MKPIAVLDLETDPFEFGKQPQPFLSGYYDGKKFISIWDESACITKTLAMLAKEKAHIIYAHNGGKFDFFYFLDYLHGQPRIINGRIVQANLLHHEIRDSYAMLPFPLEKYKKDEIDYNKLHRIRRNRHKDEIVSYLKTDCVSLYELVTAFLEEFGNVLTVGSASMKQIKARHPFDCCDSSYDKLIRSQFYFGGRVQCFQTGYLRKPLKCYDVNSMYPYVMRSYQHPIGTSYNLSTTITSKTFFVVAEGHNLGAFCERDQRTGGITFTRERGTFATSIHEWNVAEHLGLFRASKIIRTYSWDKIGCFDTFVNDFYSARLKAEASGDALHKLFYKYILNAGYGKFAQNPANFYDWKITKMEVLPEPWELAAIEMERYCLWKKPVIEQRFYNIAIGASITGAARSVLLSALYHSIEPAYCDTDSIICKDLSGVPLSQSEIGSWKLEGQFASAAIAGKKLYALYDSAGKCCKIASKGVHLNGKQMRAIANGAIITTRRDAPTYSLTGGITFQEREVKRTA